jgi:hypothetical protein
LSVDTLHGALGTAISLSILCPKLVCACIWCQFRLLSPLKGRESVYIYALRTLKCGRRTVETVPTSYIQVKHVYSAAKTVPAHGRRTRDFSVSVHRYGTDNARHGGQGWLDKVRLLAGQARQSCRARMPEKENPRGGFLAKSHSQSAKIPSRSPSYR